MAKKKIRRGRFILLITAAIFCILYIIFGFQHQTLSAKRVKMEKLKTDIEYETQVNQQLKSKIESANNGSRTEDIVKNPNIARLGERTFVDVNALEA